MKVSVLHLTPLVVVLFVTGCASTTIKNPNAYQQVPLRQAEHMPSKAALAGDKSRVVVYALEDKKWPGTGEEVADKVANELNATNNVVVVDRGLAARLRDEIQMAETKGHTGYKGQDVADFAITGKITDASAGVKYTAARSEVNKKGERTHIPAQCTTSGRSAFSLKIIQLPSLDVIKTMDFEATAFSTQGADHANNCVRVEPGAANRIVSEATADAMRKARVELTNQFAPSGYVVDRRTHEKKNIFKTTLGEAGGAKQGLTAKIVRTVSEKNALTDETTTEEVIIAEGVISDQIGRNSSFVIVSDQEQADKILQGDKVQVKYEKSITDHILGGIESINKVVK